MRSQTKTIRIPTRLIDVLEVLRKPDGPLSEYRTENAMHVGTLLYCAIFPKAHSLTTALMRLPAEDLDLILDFLYACRKKNVDLSGHLPKPATAPALLELAQKWRQTAGR